MADFRNLKHCIVAKILQNRSRLSETLVTRYDLPDHKISDELKSRDSFWIYPPLWTSLLVAMRDDIDKSIYCSNLRCSDAVYWEFSLKTQLWFVCLYTLLRYPTRKSFLICQMWASKQWYFRLLPETLVSVVKPVNLAGTSDKPRCWDWKVPYIS